MRPHGGTAWRLALRAALLIPCGCAPAPSPSEPNTATASAESCGSYQTTNQQPCPPDLVPMARCLIGALDQCRAAHLSEVAQTDEGGSVERTFEVIVEDGACQLVVTTDWRNDPYGPGWQFSRFQCETAELTSNASGCWTLTPAGCGPEARF